MTLVGVELDLEELCADELLTLVGEELDWVELRVDVLILLEVELNWDEVLILVSIELD